MKLIRILALVALFAPAACATDHPTSPPWHFVDYWFTFEQDMTLREFSTDIEVRSPIAEDVRFYISPIGGGHVNGVMSYGGIQTRSDGYETQEQTRRVTCGRGAIFSRWGTREFDDMRPVPEGLFESSGHEGDFVGVRAPFNWSTGLYTYVWRQLEVETDDEGKPHVWIGAFVYDHQTKEETKVGALRFPGDKFTLARSIPAFLEVYGPSIPIEEIPRVEVHFGNWRADGEPVLPKSATAIYPKHVPQLATSEWAGTKVIARLGDVLDREAGGYKDNSWGWSEQLIK